jgi:hypothetical protein
MTTVRSSRAGSATFLIVVAISIAMGAGLSAHRRDEYLQAARIVIDPDRVQIELDLTPGIAVADGVLSEVDVDANRTISAAEARAYAERVLRAIALDVDGMPLDIELVDAESPALDAVLNGEGTARIHAVAALPRLADGGHQLRYRNSYRADIAVYLANVLVPESDRVSIAAQRRDVDQRDLLVAYTLRADPATRTREGLSLGIGGALILIANVWWRRSRQQNYPREDLC